MKIFKRIIALCLILILSIGSLDLNVLAAEKDACELEQTGMVEAEQIAVSEEQMSEAVDIVQDEGTEIEISSEQRQH